MTNHRSVSQINTYTTCPKKYKFHYLDNLNIMTDSSAKTFGSALHKAQEFNYKQKIKSRKDLPLAEIQDFMIEFMIKEFKNNEDNENFFKIKYGKREDPEKLMDSAKNVLAKLYSDIMIKTQPLYVELPITLEILGQEFIMYIDLIDENEIIRDLKTSASKYSEDVLDYNTQLVAYALGYRKRFNKKEKGVGLDVVIKTKEPQIQQFQGEISDAKIDNFLNTLEQVNKGIENAIFPPVNSQMTCSWCDFKDLCVADGLPDAKVLAKKLKDIKNIDIGF